MSMLTRVQRRQIHDAIQAHNQQAAFKVLPEAGQIPQPLYNAFTAVARAEGELKHAKQALSDLENEITAPDPTGDGWPAHITRDYIKTMRRAIQHRIAAALSLL